MRAGRRKFRVTMSAHPLAQLDGKLPTVRTSVYQSFCFRVRFHEEALRALAPISTAISRGDFACPHKAMTQISPCAPASACHLLSWANGAGKECPFGRSVYLEEVVFAHVG